MNMISELRQRVRQFGKAEITAAEYNKLQVEWIMRTGIDSSAQYDATREAFVSNLEQQLAAAHEAIEAKNAAIRLALEEGDLFASDDAKLEAALAMGPK